MNAERITASFTASILLPVDLICDGYRALRQFQFLPKTIHYCYTIVSGGDTVNTKGGRERMERRQGKISGYEGRKR